MQRLVQGSALGSFCKSIDCLPGRRTERAAGGLYGLSAARQLLQPRRNQAGWVKAEVCRKAGQPILIRIGTPKHHLLCRQLYN